MSSGIDLPEMPAAEPGFAKRQFVEQNVMVLPGNYPTRDQDGLIPAQTGYGLPWWRNSMTV